MSQSQSETSIVKTTRAGPFLCIKEEKLNANTARINQEIILHNKEAKIIANTRRHLA